MSPVPVDPPEEEAVTFHVPAPPLPPLGDTELATLVSELQHELRGRGARGFADSMPLDKPQLHQAAQEIFVWLQEQQASLAQRLAAATGGVSLTPRQTALVLSQVLRRWLARGS